MPKVGTPAFPPIYLGIDPGASGGLASLCGRKVCAMPMPGTEADTWEWFNLQSAPFGNPAFAVIEWIHPAIQGIGKSPMSKLYGNYMALRMALTASRIPHEVIMPAKWQKALGISTKGKTEDRTKWKNRLKQKAQQLFPDVNVTLATADALLIAEYCRRFREGRLSRE